MAEQVTRPEISDVKALVELTIDGYNPVVLLSYADISHR